MRQAVRSADGKLAINSAGRSKLKSVRSTVSTTQTKGEGKQSQPYKNMAIPRKMGHSQAPKEAILAFFSADFGKQARIYGLAARAQPPFPSPNHTTQCCPCNRPVARGPNPAPDPRALAIFFHLATSHYPLCFCDENAPHQEICPSQNALMVLNTKVHCSCARSKACKIIRAQPSCCTFFAV